MIMYLSLWDPHLVQRVKETEEQVKLKITSTWQQDQDKRDTYTRSTFTHSPGTGIYKCGEQLYEQWHYL
jgi:hypothetical protein